MNARAMEQQLQDLRRDISETTGFDFGEMFDSPDEVREYFRTESFREMLDGELPGILKDQRDRQQVALQVLGGAK